MNSILTSLEQSGNWKEVMRLSCKKNGLKTSLASQLTLLKLQTLGNRFNRSYQNLGEKVGTIWIENELKAYHWILVALSAIQHILIINFREEQWTFLQSIFLFKSRSFLKFQAIRLTSFKTKNKNWIQSEDLLLKKIVEKDKEPLSQHDRKNLQWNDIARTLFQLSDDKIFKTGKHCRERWLNYLDPSKQRGEWTEEQDYILISRVLDSGKKWSEYALQLNRTQHTVKNRFNSLMIKQKKLTPHLKKEQRLIQQLKIHLRSSQNMNEDEQQMVQMSSDQKSNESVSAVREEIKQLEEQSKQKLERQCREQEKVEGQRVVEERVIVEEEITIAKEERGKEEDEEKVQKIITADNLEEKEVRELYVQKISPSSSGIMRFVRDAEQYKNPLAVNEFGHIYSPYWTYSPSNGTPNGFMNSPSPLSYYINYSFTQSFSRFTGQGLNNFAVGKPKEEK